MSWHKRSLVIFWALLIIHDNLRQLQGALPACPPAISGSSNIQTSCKITSATGVYTFSELVVDKPVLFETTSSVSFYSVNVTGRLKIGLLGSIVVGKNRKLGGATGGVTIGGHGSGGSHAGRGGSPKLGWLSKNVATPTGNPFDPTNVGGSGGDGTPGGSGGAGGGGIQIWSNVCEISGSISANGEDAEGTKNGGGGAGGTVSLHCNELIGRPILEARGGRGDGNGGGGSGGRVRLQFNTGSFNGGSGLHAQGGKVGSDVVSLGIASGKHTMRDASRNTITSSGRLNRSPFRPSSQASLQVV